MGGRERGKDINCPGFHLVFGEELWVAVAIYINTCILTSVCCMDGHGPVSHRINSSQVQEVVSEKEGIHAVWRGDGCRKNYKEQRGNIF